MVKFFISAATACLLLSGCAGRPIDTSHFEPIFKFSYPTANRLDLMATASTAPQPLPVEAQTVTPEPRPLPAEPAVRRRMMQPAIADSQATRVAATASPPIDVVRPIEDHYRLGPDGKTILLPSKPLEIIDLRSINQALDAN